MKDNNVNKLLLVTTILSVVIMLIGATFSYFTVSARSKLDAITVEAGKIDLGISVSDKTSGIKLIPINDTDIMTAYENNCIDEKGFGACNVFEIYVANFNGIQDLVGTIDFEIKDIENLKYMVLDENNEPYVGPISLQNGLNNNLTLGEHFVLETGSDINPNKKIFKLVIWLSNFDRPQDDEDAGGTYAAVIKYTSVDGRILTGTINGIK